MARQLYVWAFMLVAAAFVPVILNFGIVFYVVPSAYIALFVGGTFLKLKFAQSLGAFGHLAVCLFGFYATARGTFWLSMLPKPRAIRSAIQIVFLLAVFSCSFLRVITYSSLQGQGGTYNFWSAVSRYLEKQHSR